MDFDVRHVGIGISGLGVLLVLIRLLIAPGLGLAIGIIAIITGVIVYFVGANNIKQWERVKKDLYPEGGPEEQKQ